MIIGSQMSRAFERAKIDPRNPPTTITNPRITPANECPPKSVRKQISKCTESEKYTSHFERPRPTLPGREHPGWNFRKDDCEPEERVDERDFAECESDRKKKRRVSRNGHRESEINNRVIQIIFVFSAHEFLQRAARSNRLQDICTRFLRKSNAIDRTSFHQFIDALQTKQPGFPG